MFRFIGNFFLFGLLFYSIHRYFPEVFETFVDLADTVWVKLSQIAQDLLDKSK